MKIQITNTLVDSSFLPGHIHRWDRSFAGELDTPDEVGLDNPVRGNCSDRDNQERNRS